MERIKSERDEGYRQQEAERVRRPFTTKAEVTLSGKVEIDGTVEDVLADPDFEPRMIRRVDLRAGDYMSTNERVTFRADNDGVRLEIKGARPWVDAHAVRLDRAVRRSVPWWAYVRGWPLVLALYVVGLAVWARLGGFTLTDEFAIGDAIGSLFGWSVIWLAGSLIVMVVVGRVIVPGVEVVEPPGQSRGRWAMGVVGGLVLTVVGSVLTAVLGLV